MTFSKTSGHSYNVKTEKPFPGKKEATNILQDRPYKLLLAVPSFKSFLKIAFRNC